MEIKNMLLGLTHKNLSSQCSVFSLSVSTRGIEGRSYKMGRACFHFRVTMWKSIH